MELRMLNRIIEKIAFKKPIKNYSLDNILKHAVKNTEYYKNFDYTNLDSFPILTKSNIKMCFEDLKSKDLSRRNWWVNTTGGSTGEPVKFIQDREYLLAGRYTTYMQKTKIGYKFGDPFIKIWGDEKEIVKCSYGFKTNFINKIKNITFLNSFNMTQKNMFNFVKEINSKQPRLIVSYVQPMYELSKFIKKNNLKIGSVGAIITSAGTLYPFMRELIEEVFNTQVYNRYGSREVGSISCEKPNVDGLVISNDVYIEIVDNNGGKCKDGVEGDVLVTSLTNYSMPFIRYKIGDRGVLDSTKYNFPVLKKVSGRGMEMFRTFNGGIVPAEYFIHIIGVVINKKNSWIKKFQVIQKNFNLIEVRIVRDSLELKEDLRDIEIGIQRVMGSDCRVLFNFPEDINSLKSGKFLYTICELNNV
jgi:phenylacetate-CoA ligase